MNTVLQKALEGVSAIATVALLTSAVAAATFSLTVYPRTGAERTTLHLQPGFATVIRADRRIDTVAVGDPRLVTATTVRRGTDVFDLVLQAQADTGATNMIIWFGDLATVWNLEIGPGPRTADLVYVVTNQQPATHQATASRAGASQIAAQPALSPQVQPRHLANPTATSTPPSQGANETSQNDQSRRLPDLIELSREISHVVGVFKINHVQDGALVRYQITNNGTADLVLRPGGVLVRINGRITPYGMTRDIADRERPDVIPKGATETGTINVASPAPRVVHLVMSFFPVVQPADSIGPPVPLIFESTFTGVDALTITSPF